MAPRLHLLDIDDPPTGPDAASLSFRQDRAIPCNRAFCSPVTGRGRVPVDDDGEMDDAVRDYWPRSRAATQASPPATPTPLLGEGEDPLPRRRQARDDVLAGARRADGSSARCPNRVGSTVGATVLGWRDCGLTIGRGCPRPPGAAARQREWPGLSASTLLSPGGPLSIRSLSPPRWIRRRRQTAYGWRLPRSRETAQPP